MERSRKLFIIAGLILLLTGCEKNSTFQGYIEGEYSYLASAVSGNLTQLLVSRGDQVVAGQPLFVLDPQPEADKLRQATSNLAQAKEQLINLEKGQRETVMNALVAQHRQALANLDIATKTMNRYEALYKNRAIDKESLDQSVATYEQSKQRVKELEANIAEAKLGARENLINAQEEAVKAAEADVKQAEWALLQKSVRAPTNGQIFDTLYYVGEFVNAGTPVVVLLPPNKIKVIFYVAETVVSKVKVNDTVVLSCDGCKQNYNAVIRFISPEAEFTPPVIFSKDSRDKLVYRIEAYPDLKDAAQLHPGQPVDVRLIKNEELRTKN